MKGWRSRHIRRSALTSARSFSDASSVFFIGEPVPAQELGQVRGIGRHTVHRLQPGGQIRHGDVRLRLHLVENGLRVRAELARSPGASLPGRINRTGRRKAGLHPRSRLWRHPKLGRHRAARLSRCNAAHHSKPKIVRNRFAHEIPPRPHGITVRWKWESLDSYFAPDALARLSARWSASTAGR